MNTISQPFGSTQARSLWTSGCRQGTDCKLRERSSSTAPRKLISNVRSCGAQRREGREVYARQSEQLQHKDQKLPADLEQCFSRRSALLSSAGAAAAVTLSDLSGGLSAQAKPLADCVKPINFTDTGCFLNNHSAAAAVPVWETGNATGNIKTAPEETSEYLGTAALDGLNSAETRALELNSRIQQQNAAPMDFPAFIRQGFNVKIVADGYLSSPEGLVFRDYQVGDGEIPVDGQEVVFDYTAYNEQGRRIDSTYNKSAPARTRLGIQGLIPGFELGLRSMRVGGKRRLVVPPQLGPPTGPSTFFSAKQCEVFDVELRAVRNCSRRQMGMFSDVVCE